MKPSTSSAASFRAFSQRIKALVIRRRVSGHSPVGASLWIGMIALILPCLCGCDTARFYAQAIHGQSQMVHRQQSISKLLARTNTSPELAIKLRLVLDIRRFAESELELPANGHYTTYADLGRRFAVWNVYAAPEFSLEAKSWWYPVVGRLTYRGYFSEQAARRHGTNLANRGHDVYVGGVQAYSTLGWFRDPVLNTFVFDDDADLAELLFHELAHQRVFVPGDTDFNEAFASAVAEEGVRRWLRARERATDLARYESELGRKEQFVELLARSRARLESVYTNQAAAAFSFPAILKARKNQIFTDLRSDYEALRSGWSGPPNYDNWFKHPLNNARLNTVETYYRLLPAFRRLIERCDGRLHAFFDEVERLAKLKKEKRHERLEGLLAEARADSPSR